MEQHEATAIVVALIAKGEITDAAAALAAYRTLMTTDV